MTRPLILSVACILAVGLWGNAEASTPPPPEPADYRYDNYRSPVPLTLQGATVVDTAALVRQLGDDARTIVVDVLPREPRPPRLAPGNVWRPPPHEGLPGAMWLPNVGYGRLPAPLFNYFVENLRQATDGDRERPLVFYCRSDCWMSWNSARRALGLGYRQVLWYRDGIEAWQAAGHPTAILQPFGNPPDLP